MPRKATCTGGAVGGNDAFAKALIAAALGAKQGGKQKNQGNNKKKIKGDDDKKNKEKKTPEAGNKKPPPPLTEEYARNMFKKLHGYDPKGTVLAGFLEDLKRQRKREENAKLKVTIKHEQMRFEDIDMFVDERTGMRIKTLLENAPLLVERSGRPAGRIVYFGYIKAYDLWVIGVEYPFTSAALFVSIRSPATVRIEEAYDVQGRFHDPMRGAIAFVRKKANLKLIELFSRPTHGDYEPVPTSVAKLSPSNFEYVVQTSELNDFLTRTNFLKLKYKGIMVASLEKSASSFFAEAVGERRMLFTASPPHKLVFIGFDADKDAFVLGFDFMKKESSCALYVVKKLGGFAFNGIVKKFESSFFPDGYRTVQKGRLYDLYGDPFDIELAASVRDLSGVDHDRKPGFFDLQGRRTLAKWNEEKAFRAAVASKSAMLPVRTLPAVSAPASVPPKGSPKGAFTYHHAPASVPPKGSPKGAFTYHHAPASTLNPSPLVSSAASAAKVATTLPPAAVPKKQVTSAPSAPSYSSSAASSSTTYMPSYKKSFGAMIAGSQ